MAHTTTFKSAAATGGVKETERTVQGTVEEAVARLAQPPSAPSVSLVVACQEASTAAVDAALEGEREAARRAWEAGLRVGSEVDYRSSDRFWWRATVVSLDHDWTVTIKADAVTFEGSATARVADTSTMLQPRGTYSGPAPPPFTDAQRREGGKVDKFCFTNCGKTWQRGVVRGTVATCVTCGSDDPYTSTPAWVCRRGTYTGDHPTHDAKVQPRANTAAARLAGSVKEPERTVQGLVDEAVARLAQAPRAADTAAAVEACAPSVSLAAACPDGATTVVVEAVDAALEGEREAARRVWEAGLQVGSEVDYRGSSSWWRATVVSLDRDGAVTVKAEKVGFVGSATAKVAVTSTSLQPRGTYSGPVPPPFTDAQLREGANVDLWCIRCGHSWQPGVVRGTVATCVTCGCDDPYTSTAAWACRRGAYTGDHPTHDAKAEPSANTAAARLAAVTAKCGFVTAIATDGQLADQAAGLSEAMAANQAAVTALSKAVAGSNSVQLYRAAKLLEPALGTLDATLGTVARLPGVDTLIADPQQRRAAVSAKLAAARETVKGGRATGGGEAAGWHQVWRLSGQLLQESMAVSAAAASADASTVALADAATAVSHAAAPLQAHSAALQGHVDAVSAHLASVQCERDVAVARVAAAQAVARRELAAAEREKARRTEAAVAAATAATAAVAVALRPAVIAREALLGATATEAALVRRVAELEEELGGFKARLEEQTTRLDAAAEAAADTKANVDVVVESFHATVAALDALQAQLPQLLHTATVEAVRTAVGDYTEARTAHAVASARAATQLDSLSSGLESLRERHAVAKTFGVVAGATPASIEASMRDLDAERGRVSGEREELHALGGALDAAETQLLADIEALAGVEAGAAEASSGRSVGDGDSVVSCDGISYGVYELFHGDSMNSGGDRGNSDGDSVEDDGDSVDSDVNEHGVSGDLAALHSAELAMAGTRGYRDMCTALAEAVMRARQAAAHAAAEHQRQAYLRLAELHRADEHRSAAAFRRAQVQLQASDAALALTSTPAPASSGHGVQVLAGAGLALSACGVDAELPPATVVGSPEA